MSYIFGSNSKIAAIFVPTIFTSVTISTGYQIDSLRDIIVAASANTFRTARSVSVASNSAEYGWSKINITNLTSADENTTTANAFHFAHATTATDYSAITKTGPFRYQVIPYNGVSLEVVARLYSNAAAGASGAILMIRNSASVGVFSKIGVGYFSGNPAVFAYNGTTDTPNTITSGQRDAGCWVRQLMLGTVLTVWYSTATDMPVDDGGWTYLATQSFAAVPNNVDIGILAQNTTGAAGQTGGCKWFGYRIPGNSWSHASGFQAEQYLTTTPSITIYDDAYVGTISDADLNSFVQTAAIAHLNSQNGDAGSWEINVTRSDTKATYATETWTASSAIACTGSGIYARVKLRYTSNGIQRATIRGKVLCIVT